MMSIRGIYRFILNICGGFVRFSNMHLVIGFESTHWSDWLSCEYYIDNRQFVDGLDNNEREFRKYSEFRDEINCPIEHVQLEFHTSFKPRVISEPSINLDLFFLNIKSDFVLDFFSRYSCEWEEWIDRYIVVNE